MSSLEEALQISLESTIAVVCAIDTDTRRITVPDSVAQVIGVESDESAKVVHFSMKNIFGDKAKSLQFYINYKNANEEVDSYYVSDVNVEDDNITFSWTLSRKVTAYKGKVNFIVCVKSSSSDYEWNTTLATATVLEGLEPDISGGGSGSGTGDSGGSDVLAQLVQMMQDTTNNVQQMQESLGQTNSAVSQLQTNVDGLLGSDSTLGERIVALETEAADYESFKENVSSGMGIYGSKIASVEAGYTQLSANLEKFAQSKTQLSLATLDERVVALEERPVSVASPLAKIAIQPIMVETYTEVTE